MPTMVGRGGGGGGGGGACPDLASRGQVGPKQHRMDGSDLMLPLLPLLLLRLIERRISLGNGV